MTGAGENGKKAKKSRSRGERLAAALRENLRRRKAQERVRGTQSGTPTRAKSGPLDDKTS